MPPLRYRYIVKFTTSTALSMRAAPALAGLALFLSLADAASAASTLQVTSINASALIAGTGQTLGGLVTAESQAAAAVATAQSTATQANASANAAIPLSQKGAAGGVATLDASGNVTAPLSTTSAAASLSSTIGWNSALTWAINSGTGTQYANPKIAANQPWQMGTDSSGTAVYDDYLPPTHLRLGGSQEFDGVPLFVHNVPYGPDDMGVVDGVFMQSENMRGSEAGVGPDGASGIASYDNFDAVARYTFAGTNSPIFVATGAAVTAPDGLTHTPTFTATGATFANPLPASWSNWITNHPHVRMMTNELGSSSGYIKTYAGQLTGYTTNSAGLVTAISTDGWRIFNASASTTNQIPGTSTVDGSTAALDTVWSDFQAPAIMFGVYTKAFGENVICSLPGPTPNASPGDINYPTGNANNQVRSCEGIEYDLWNNDTTGNTAYMRGITVAYSGNTSPTADSYDMDLAGGNATMLNIAGEWYSANISSRPFSSAGYGGPAYAAGSQSVIADFDQSNRPGWDADSAFPTYSHNMRVTLWNTRNTNDTSNTNDYNDITTSLGVQVDGHASPTLAMDGTIQEHLEFNPSNFPNGIALCGYQICGFAINGSGNAQFSADANILSGKSLLFTNTKGTQIGSLYGGTDGAIHISSTTGSTGIIAVAAKIRASGAINAGNVTYSTLPSSSAAVGDQDYCTDCYSTSNSSATKGVPVWWNGSNWTDALGNTVNH